MNCIWITIDSTRQDHVNCYSPGGTRDLTGESMRVQTPSIDRLAGEGVRFNKLRMEALPTVPARRGIFSGRRVFPFAYEHPRKGMYITLPGWRPLRQSDVTAAEHLSEHGYVCGLVADVYHLMKPSQNFHRGFQSFQWVRGNEYDQWQSQPLPPGYLERYLKPGIELPEPRLRVLSQWLRNQMYRQGDDDYQGARVFRTAIEWLERNHTHENFFLYIDSFDPHEPNEAPQQFVDLYDPGWDGPDLIYGNLYRRDQLTAAEHHHLRAKYAANLTMVDHWIGRLLDKVDELGRREDTLIIFMSDHGKVLGENGAYGMPPSATGPLINSVPFIMRHPSGQHAGLVSETFVYNTDVTATMMALLGVPPKPVSDGLDLWPSLDGGELLRETAVVGHGEIISAWRGDWLYLYDTHENRASLYHLAADPDRQHDVATRYPTERDALRSVLEQVAGEQ